MVKVRRKSVTPESAADLFMIAAPRVPPHMDGTVMRLTASRDISRPFEGASAA